VRAEAGQRLCHLDATPPAHQLGNLLAPANATIRASIAQGHGGDHGLGLAVVAGMAAIAIVVVTALGKEEAKGVVFGHPRRAG
jgi:hypothetical protein